MTSSSATRVVFAGTPEFAATALRALLQANTCIVGVYTQPDRRRGRGKQVSPSPVKAVALEHDLPVLQPQNFKAAADVAQLKELQADVMVVAAYGLLLPQAVLDTPLHGCLNIHASLLPRWRGAAPVERAIEHGDRETGVTIMQMDAGLDTGPMLHKVVCPIGSDDTSDSLRAQLADLGGAAIVAALQQLPELSHRATPQPDDLATYAAKISKAECELDWQQPAVALARKIRGFYSGYTCYSSLGDQRIKFAAATALAEPHQQLPGTVIGTNKTSVQVACGDGVLAITQLQLPGAKMLAARDVLNSRAALFAGGVRFSAPAVASGEKH